MKSVLIVFSLIFLSGCGAVVVTRPENPHVVIIPDSPGPAYGWVNDSWRWDRRSRSYAVQKGHWVKPKRNSVVWVDGRWINTRGGWKYVRGHWRRGR